MRALPFYRSFVLLAIIIVSVLKDDPSMGFVRIRAGARSWGRSWRPSPSLPFSRRGGVGRGPSLPLETLQDGALRQEAFAAAPSHMQNVKKNLHSRSQASTQALWWRRWWAAASRTTVCLGVRACVFSNSDIYVSIPTMRDRKSVV